MPTFFFLLELCGNMISYINKHPHLIGSFDHDVHPHKPSTRKHKAGHCVSWQGSLRVIPSFQEYDGTGCLFCYSAYHKVQ